MKSGLKIILVVGILIVLMVGIFLIFRSNGNISENEGRFNIKAVDKHNDNLKIGYEIMRGSYGSSVIDNRTTLRKGFITSRVPVNTSLNIHTYNLEDQSYYSDVIEDLKVKSNDSRRVTLHPQESGEISVFHNKELDNKNNNLTLNINADGLIKNLGLCVKWSNNLVYAKPKGIGDEIETEGRFESYIDCYKINDSIKNKDVEVDINYKRWDDLEKDDSIHFFVIDGDRDLRGVDYGEKEDKFAEDKEYIVNASIENYS